MHPVLFKVPLLDWEVYSYGALLGLSLIVAWFLVHQSGRREGLPRETVADAFVVSALGGLVGARLLYVLTNLEDFSNPIKVIQIGEGGLAAWGGLLGGTLAAWFFLRRKRLSLWAWLDAVTPAVLLGSSITRIGSFLHGSDFGREIAETPWSVRFPAGSPVYEWHDQTYGLAAQGMEWSRPVHPVQLYAAAAGLLLFGLALLGRRYRRFGGELFLVGTFLFSLATYLLEGFRGDPHRGWLLMWSTAQVIAVAAALAAAALYALRWRRARRNPAAAFDLGPGIADAIAADRAGRSD